MKNIKYLILLFLILNIKNCTLIKHLNNQNDLFIARSMDFGAETFPKIKFVKEKSSFKSSSQSINPNKIIEEKRLFKYIGISVFENENLICQGVNENGLHISTLWFPDAIYDGNTKKENLQKDIEISEISDFILSCFENTEDIKKYFLNVSVWSRDYKELNGKIPAHFSIIDKNGNEIVLESINGRLKIFDNYFGVLTNVPSFDWHVNNLRNYINLEGKSVPQKEVSNLIFKQNGYGNGLMGLPGDFTSTSRFVRAFCLKNLTNFTENPEEVLSFLGGLMGNLTILPGFERTGNDYTQWHILILNNEKILIKFFDELNYIEIDLKKIFKTERNGFSKYIKNFKEKRKKNFKK